jgi:hypothetical protein
MLLAMVGFVQQAAMIAASQARASAGIMPDPAIALSGPVHVHDRLAGHVHVHGGMNVAGHVHSAADVDDDDDDDADGIGHPPVWSLGSTFAVISLMGVSAVSLEAMRVGECRHERGEGVEPDGLHRPPSTPSIG